MKPPLGHVATMMIARRWLLAIATWCLAALPFSPALAASPSAETVHIETGTLRGLATGTHRAFLGIPFAKPPVGPLRWKAPQPADAWQGERDATRMAMACAQPLTLLSVVVKAYSEDCLYLNVYTPAGAVAGASLPVIVWIHGGAFMTGSASEYPAASLAEVTQSVVVTVNYRLGAFGFMAVPEIRQEDPRLNFGLQDQQAALRWVQRNITQFGGNKNLVTLAGESAGGQSVLFHLISPPSQGLMHRAIVQSAAATGLFNGTMSVEQGIVHGEARASAAGCPAGTDQRMDCLRGKSTEEILQAIPYSMDFRAPSVGATVIVDGTLYPAQLFDRFKSGEFARVPVLMGMTRDELQFLVALSYDILTGQPATEAQYQSALGAFGTPAAASKLLTTFYPSWRHGSPGHALGALLTDFLFICPNHRVTKALAKHTPTFAYRFDDREAPTFFPMPEGVKMRAYHGSEVPYLFDMWTDKPLNAQQRVLATQMKKYWGNFARTGDPNRSLMGDDKTVPWWPRFTPLVAPYLSLRTGGPGILGLGELPRQHQCLLWDTIESFIPPPAVETL